MNTPTRSFEEEKPRPLFVLSDYVAQELPQELARIRSGISNADSLSRIVDDLIADIRTTPESSASLLSDMIGVQQKVAAAQSRNRLGIALLDLSMLENAISAHGGTPSESLQTFTNAIAQAKGDIPSLTYEGLIHHNPIDEDPRTFTGDAEVFFYRTHARIESLCAKAIQELQTLVRNREVSDVIADTLSDRVTPVVVAITAELKTLLAELPVQSFDAFRPYLGGNAARGQSVGPSGNFSAGMFTLDALLAGEDSDMRTFLHRKLSGKAFFPRTSLAQDGFAGQADMDEAGHSVADRRTVQILQSDVGMFHKQCPNVIEAARTLFAEMAQMRTTHVAVARQFIGQALAGQGTGGEKHLLAYLSRPVVIYERLAAYAHERQDRFLPYMTIG